MPPDATRASLAVPRPPGGDWEGVRLHVVTGKGGTGKTTVSGALALALAAGGRRVLVLEVEGRQGLAQLFDTPPLPYDERRVATAPGGEVFALAVDAEQALLEYLDLFYKLGRAGRILDKLGAVDFATTVAPGLRDVLLTGKAYEAVRRRRAGRRTYDAVVLDAPPTGRITRFLNVNSEVAGLARVGPVRKQSDSIMALLRSTETVVHIVTLLEEMPVQETTDAVTELRGAGLRVGAIIVNLVRRPPLSRRDLAAAAKGHVDAESVGKTMASVGLRSAGDVVSGLLREAAELSQRVALERVQRRRVDALGRPTYELPFAAEGVDVGTLHELAYELHEQGAA